MTGFRPLLFALVVASACSERDLAASQEQDLDLGKVSISSHRLLPDRGVEFTVLVENHSDLQRCFEWWEEEPNRIQYKDETGKHDLVHRHQTLPTKEEQAVEIGIVQIAPKSRIELRATKTPYDPGYFIPSIDAPGRPYTPGDPVRPHAFVILYDCQHPSENAALHAGQYEMIHSDLYFPIAPK